MAKAPEATFRLGNISSSVFVQESEGSNVSLKREFRSVSLQRSCRDGEETKFVSNFTLSDLPAAIRCLQLAQKYVEDREIEVT